MSYMTECTKLVPFHIIYYVTTILLHAKHTPPNRQTRESSEPAFPLQIPVMQIKGVYTKYTCGFTVYGCKHSLQSDTNWGTL